MDKSILKTNVNSKAGKSGFTLILLMVLIVLMFIGALATVPSVLAYTAQRVRAGQNLQVELTQWGRKNEGIECNELRGF